MVKLTVLYGPPSDPAAFDEYYMGTHVPIANALPGLRRNEVSKVSGTLDGSTSAYYLHTDLYFDSAEALMAAVTSPEGAAAAADVGKFATGGVTMLTSDVLLEG